MTYTYQELYLATKEMLRQTEGENAEFVARELVAAATDRTVSQLVADFRMSVFQRDITRVDEMAKRYIKGEPMAYILGTWDFYGLKLKITPDVLIPRDDTEPVCALAIEMGKKSAASPRILDLCCGSGCIGLAIASKIRTAKVTLADVSAPALAIAKRNAQDLKLGSRVSCVEVDALKPAPKFLGKYDLIVSNPPYVTARQMQELAPSVKDFEPHLALYGGEDGLDFYRSIVKHYTSVLKPGGYLCFEFGMGQEADVCQILMDGGYRLQRLVRDSGERARAVLAQLPPEDEDLPFHK